MLSSLLSLLSCCNVISHCLYDAFTLSHCQSVSCIGQQGLYNSTLCWRLKIQWWGHYWSREQSNSAIKDKAITYSSSIISESRSQLMHICITKRMDNNCMWLKMDSMNCTLLYSIHCVLEKYGRMSIVWISRKSNLLTTNEWQGRREGISIRADCGTGVQES